MVTWPPLPTGTLTRFARVSPATQLRLETVLAAPPAGPTFRKLAAVVVVTVTLGTTPVAAAGTVVGPPATIRLSEPPGPSLPPVARISSSRLGLSAVYAVGSAV